SGLPRLKECFSSTTRRESNRDSDGGHDSYHNHIGREGQGLGAGGLLWFKGNERLLSEEEAAWSWNWVGLEVTDLGGLRYFVGEGANREAVVETPPGLLFSTEGELFHSDCRGGRDGVQGERGAPREGPVKLCGMGSTPSDSGSGGGAGVAAVLDASGLPHGEEGASVRGSTGGSAEGSWRGRSKEGGAGAWSHVAVVQDGTKVSLYVDGEARGMGSLPRHLLRPSRPESRVTIKEVESAHPYPESTDSFWKVCIPGASHITIRFDPKTRTEPMFDYLRFYKDHTRTQTWGKDKYHGGRSGSAGNWPGVDIPPLEIPSDSFLVHFHSDHSHSDYGFRLTAEGHCLVFPEPDAEPEPKTVAMKGVEGGGGESLPQPSCIAPAVHGNLSPPPLSATGPPSADDVNPWPLFLGQPPPLASRKRKAMGGGGCLTGVCSWGHALRPEEVRSLASSWPRADTPRNAVMSSPAKSR
ncbi:unnamed protein product, partial [Discosporangium mesarthrocarpum]